MGCDDIIFEFCMLLSEVLNHAEIVQNLSKDDIAFITKVKNHTDIDSKTLTVKDQTYIDVLIYDLCMGYVQSNIANNPAFDIGVGIEAIENYSNLLKKYCAENNMHLQHTYINIMELVVQRLKTIDFASNQSQLRQQSEILSDRILDSNLRVNELQTNLQETKKKVKDTLLMVDDVIKKKNDIYKDIVTIISIFAAIILTMSGVFSFSSTVLENINSANFYKLMVIVLVLGIMFSSIFLGSYYFLYNVRHDIKEKNPATHKHRWLSPLIVVDIVFFILIIIILVFKGNLLVKNSDFDNYEREKGNKSETHFQVDYFSVENDPRTSHEK